MVQWQPLPQQQQQQMVMIGWAAQHVVAYFCSVGISM
jgi:hypothetical protein